MHKENLMPVERNLTPIEIRNLTKTFGAVRALDGLDLLLERVSFLLERRCDVLHHRVGCFLVDGDPVQPLL